MIDFREYCVRNQEKAAAAAALAAQSQQKTAIANTNTNSNTMNNRLIVGTASLPNGSASRSGTLYESRSSISSPYGSGSSLNRTSSIRRASLRDREKVKKLNENFLDVLQAKDKIQEDTDDNTIAPNPPITNGTIPSKLSTKEECSSSTTLTDSTVRDTNAIKKATNKNSVESPLPNLKLPPLLPPPPPVQATADTLSDVKRRREERRRGVGVFSSSNGLPPSPASPTLTSVTLTPTELNNGSSTKMSNGNHLSKLTDPISNYSAKKYIEIHGHLSDDHEKRICCTIL